MPACRLLLVEDDPVNRAFLAHALLAPGVAIEASATGLSALAAAHVVRFDLLVLDVNLPDLDGPRVLQALRATSAAASCAAPALALTADSDPGQRQRLLDAGFDAVACKPITGERLRACVTSVLAGRLGDGDAAGTPADWDDDAALHASGGDRAIVVALRSLLRDDLPKQLACIDAAIRARDTAAVLGQSHRLRAAAAFCGAPRLRAAAAALADADTDDGLRAAQRALTKAAAALMAPPARRALDA